MTKYKLFLVRVFTMNWDSTFEFYRDVIGFDVSYSDPEIGWAQFNLGNAEIALERCDPNDEESSELVGRFVGVSIEVDDIDAIYRDLCANGVEFTGPPLKQSWGGTLAHFKDPDNNILTLLGD